MEQRTFSNASFFQVSARTLTLLRLKIGSVVLGGLSFALLAAVLGVAINQRVARIEESIAAESRISVDELRENLTVRLSSFSEADTVALGNRFWLDEPDAFVPESAKPPLSADDAVFAFIAQAGPWFLFSFVLHCVVFFLACTYFLMLAVGGPHSAYDAVRGLPRMALLMIGLSLWLLVRSLLWIPLVGPFIALYLFPRFALAPAILASGESAVMPSLHESMRRTSGRWLGTTANLCGCLLTCCIFFWFILLFVVAVALFSAKLSFFLWLFLLMLTGAFVMFFVTMMTAMMA